MATLISKSEKISFTFTDSHVSYKINKDKRILVCTSNESNKAECFLEKHGFGGIYFNPEYEPEIYNDYIFNHSEEFTVIEFYN